MSSSVSPSDAAAQPDPGQLAVDLIVTSSAFTRAVSRDSWDGPRALWRSMAILRQIGPCRITELAHQDHITQPTASNLVARLESEGWARRIPDPSDRRASLIELSPAGTRQLEKLRAAAGANIAATIEELDDADRAAIERTLAIMKRIVSAAT